MNNNIIPKGSDFEVQPLEDEPPTCKICSAPFFVNICKECGYNSLEVSKNGRT